MHHMALLRAAGSGSEPKEGQAGRTHPRPSPSSRMEVQKLCICLHNFRFAKPTLLGKKKKRAG